MKTYYYIEKDGQIFLVEKKGKLTFPETKKEIPFPIEILRDMPLNEGKVFFCSPKIKDHPNHWIHKDSIPVQDKVDPIVRLAVNRSLVRHVSDAIIPQEGKVLMVKASRGLTVGMWDLPGGFISYGESPEESLLREVKEETGLDIRIKKLHHINTNIVKGFYFIALIYLCEVTGGKLQPDKTEIAEAEWLPLNDAIKGTKKLFVRKSLELYKKSLQ